MEKAMNSDKDITQGPELHKGAAYFNKDLIDARNYLDIVWKSAFVDEPSDPDLPPIAQYVMTEVHRILEQVTLPGRRQLDFGCGPSIHNILSSSRCCHDVMCAEYSPLLRREVTKWWQGDQDAYDWSFLLDFVAGLEGRKADEIEVRSRSSIKKVIPCDIFNKNMLEPEICKPFSLITSSLCIEAACPNVASYNDVIKRFFDMLEPGGIFILNGVLDQDWYYIGENKFYSLAISKEEIDSALTVAGFAPAEWKIWSLGKFKEMCSASACFVLHTKKVGSS